MGSDELSFGAALTISSSGQGVEAWRGPQRKRCFHGSEISGCISMGSWLVGAQRIGFWVASGRQTCRLSGGRIGDILNIGRKDCTSGQRPAIDFEAAKIHLWDDAWDLCQIFCVETSLMTRLLTFVS